MPGEHVDKIYQAALDKVYYTPLTDEQKLTATPERLAEDNRLKDSTNQKVGTEVFREIESSGLSDSEKQEVHLKLVQYGVTRELQNATNPATLLRGNNRLTNYMTGYMNHYAKGYIESVYDATLREATQVKLPPSVKGKNLENIGKDIEGVPPEDMAKLNDAYVKVAGKMVEASEKNLALLSPEARKFMESALKPAVLAGNKEAVNMATASTLLLRGASGPIASRAGYMRNEGESQQMGAILMNANVIAQTYANTVNNPIGEKLGRDKPQNELADRLRTKESIEQTREAYDSVSQGSLEVDKFTTKVGKPVTLEGMDKDTAKTLSKLNRIASEGPIKNDIANAKVEPQLQQIAALEKKLDALNSKWPNMEKLKAWLGKDSVKEVKEKVINQIDNLKMEVGQKVDKETFARVQGQNKQTVEGLKAEQEKVELGAAIYDVAKPEVDRLERELVQHERLKASGLPTIMTEEQAVQARKDLEGMKATVKEMGPEHQTFEQNKGELQSLEKNVSVRDQLGIKPKEQAVDGPKVEGPKALVKGPK